MGEIHDVTGYYDRIAKERAAKKRTAALEHKAHKEAGEIVVELDPMQAECLPNDPEGVSQIMGHAVIIARGIKAFKGLLRLL